MTPTTTLPSLERAIHRQMLPVLAVMAVAALFPPFHQAAFSLALGWGAAWMYYVILGRGVRKLFTKGDSGRAHAGQVLVRQGVCLLALMLAFRWFGNWGWLALASLLVGRHWVMFAASTDVALRLR